MSGLHRNNSDVLSRHDQDTFLIKDHRSDRVTILDVPYASIEWTSSLLDPLMLSHVPFVLRYFVCPRFDRQYPIYLVLPRYQQTYLLVPVILQPRDLVTRLCKLYDAISPSGPRVPIRHSDGQILLWSICILINHLFRNTQSAPLWPARWDTNQSLLIDDDYVWSLRSKDLVITL